MSDIRIENMNFEKMDFDEIRLALKQVYGENQKLRDEVALMRRYYEDLLYNIDVENFSSSVIKKGKNMQTSIEQTAEAVIIAAEKADEAVNKSAQFEVKAEEIQMIVDASYSNPITVETFNPKKAYKDCLYYEESTDLYYFFNGDSWNSSKTANIYTVFEQTADKFKLKGNVEISGNLITEGTIKGVDIVGVKYWDAEQNGYIYLNSLPGTCDFELRNNIDQAIFTVYDTIDGTQLEAYDFTFLRATPGELVVPYGTWNFAYCDVKNLDAVAKFA